MLSVYNKVIFHDVCRCNYWPSVINCTLHCTLQLIFASDTIVLSLWCIAVTNSHTFRTHCRTWHSCLSAPTKRTCASCFTVPAYDIQEFLRCSE